MRKKRGERKRCGGGSEQAGDGGGNVRRVGSGAWMGKNKGREGDGGLMFEGW